MTVGLWLTALKAPVTGRRQAFVTTPEAEADLGEVCMAQMAAQGRLERLPAKAKQVQRVRRIGQRLVQALALLPEEDKERQQQWLVCLLAC